MKYEVYSCRADVSESLYTVFDVSSDEEAIERFRNIVAKPSNAWDTMRMIRVEIERKTKPIAGINRMDGEKEVNVYGKETTPPEFPKQFCLKYCTKVQEAREQCEHWRGEPLKDTEAIHYAECAFVQRGHGMGCEACNLFIFPGSHTLNPNEQGPGQFYQEIKNYYDQQT